jgi:hypothetical protein
MPNFIPLDHVDDLDQFHQRKRNLDLFVFNQTRGIFPDFLWIDAIHTYYFYVFPVSNREMLPYAWKNVYRSNNDKNLHIGEIA